MRPTDPLFSTVPPHVTGICFCQENLSAKMTAPSMTCDKNVAVNSASGQCNVSEAPQSMLTR